MPIKKIDEVWAETGTVTEPSTGKKTLGFVPAEQPKSDEFNFLLQEIQNKINNVVDERLNSFAENSVTDPFEMIASNLYSENYGESVNSQGFISTGTAKRLFGSCISWDYEKNPLLIVYNQVEHKFYSYNPRTLSNIDVSHDVRPDLGGGSYTFHSMCSDGDYIYAVYWDGVYEVIQAWNANTWVKKWSTGLPLPVFATAFLYGKPKIIVANSTTLAVAATWISTDLGGVVTINKSTGVMIAGGAGDAASSATRYLDGQLVSDGDNLFFTTRDGTAAIHLCTATIANPSVGTGGTGYPALNPFGSNRDVILGSIGNLIISAKQDSAYADTDTIIRSHTASCADIDYITVGENYHGITSTFSLWGYPMSICSDGISAFILVNQSGQKSACAVIKIDGSKFMAHSDMVAVPRPIFEITNSRFLLGQSFANSNSTLKAWCTSLYDGRDYWAISEPEHSELSSGHIFRLPLATIRY